MEAMFRADQANNAGPPVEPPLWDPAGPPTIYAPGQPPIRDVGARPAFPSGGPQPNNGARVELQPTPAAGLHNGGDGLVRIGGVGMNSSEFRDPTRPDIGLTGTGQSACGGGLGANPYPSAID